MNKKHSHTPSGISIAVKAMRSRADLTQMELAARCGVGLRFVRDLEQGKATLRMDKINQVLALFGYHMEAVKDREDLP